EFLADGADSPVLRFTPPGADIDSVIDVRAVFQQSCRDLAVEAMPAFLMPQKGKFGLRDYEKMYCVDPKSGQNIFDMRGIDRDGGCMVVVRPDQHIAQILPLNAHAELAAFFDGFMIRKI
ncbi:MAG: 3-hydroxybenzoate 4-monooxygenase, partial [Alphaproteobacteria bacterium]|nr:3-hydroxybenzoate 4-monooxygenase [Alphaproteobacteria bacterium]